VPRPRWRAYLLLSRISNLPTVWTNVIAGTVAAPALVDRPRVTWMAVAISLIYTGGMFLNDAFDVPFDTAQRSDRPIPAGDVPARSAFAVGFVLLAAGVGAAVTQRYPGPALAWAVGLAAAVVYYDFHHKKNAWGPWVMGLCRGLVYCTAAAGAVGRVRIAVLAAAAALMLYVVMLTWIAKRIGQKASVVIPLLIAGISVLDALVVLAFGGGVPLALVTAAAAVLTLLLQRVVPGT
jgi:4-hydroxybenzoate polyprenyltransferase